MALPIALLAWIALGKPPVIENPDVGHVREVKIYADIIAVSQVAIRHCNMVGANVTMLGRIGRTLHYDSSQDVISLNSEAADERKNLEGELMSAPSIEAWCSYHYSLFGPNGTSIRGLLQQAQ